MSTSTDLAVDSASAETRDPSDLRREVDEHLTRRVRRFLDSHAGNVRVRDVTDEGRVDLEFVGACTSCPALPVTFHTAIAPVVREVAGVTEVHTSAVNISQAAVERLVALTRRRPRSTNQEQGEADE